MLVSESRWLSSAATVLLTVALFGCDKALTTHPDGGQEVGRSDSGQGTGGVIASGGNGGTTAVPSGVGGAAGSGGSTVTGGTTSTGGMAGRGGAAGSGTGGAAGSGGLTGRGGATGTGGGARNGGATGTGGATGRGGTAGSLGGGSGTGGVTITGGKPGTGGAIGGAGGRSGTGGTTGAGGSTSAAVFQPLTEAFCKAARSCCPLASYPAADLADCEAKFLSQVQTYPMVTKGTVNVDQTALAACVAAYVDAATTCTITKVYSACSGVFLGTLPTGQACGADSQFGAIECEKTGNAVVCLWESSSKASGVCRELPHGKSGEECITSCARGENCVMDVYGGTTITPTCFEEDGLYCATILDPPVCKPIRQLEQACTSDRNACGTGYYCDWTTNTCQVAKKLGESCKNAACPDSLMCDGSKCVELPFASDYLCKGSPPVP